MSIDSASRRRQYRETHRYGALHTLGDCGIFGGPSSLVTGALGRVIPRFDPAKNEIVYATAAPEINPRHNIHLFVDIAFAEWEFLKGRPTIITLQLLAHEIEGALMAIEAES